MTETEFGEMLAEISKVPNARLCGNPGVGKLVLWIKKETK